MTIAFELASLSNPHPGSIRPAGGTSYGLSTLGPNADGGLQRTPNIAGGLTALLTKDTFDKIPIIMSAVQNYEETRIVDRSFALTNDNKEATFRITNSVPYFTNDVNQGVSVQNVKTIDAVSEITVTPRVNADDNLTLKVKLTLTTLAASGAPGLPPATNRREFTGEAVTVPNNDYVVFGGLESESESEVESKVPFFGDIPILGHLFKSWQRSRSRSRVYIFVRPTVLSDDDFAADRHFADHMLERIAVAGGQDPWLPLVRDSALHGAGYTLQDQALDRFGTGSANPLSY
jgi:general secretion pathway protein D